MWSFLASLFDRGMTWLGGALDVMARSLIGGLQGLGEWLSKTFGNLFRGITEFLSAILQPFLDLVGGFVYLFSNLVDVIILIVQSLLLLVQVVMGIAGGLLRSLTALASFDPSTVPPDRNPFGTGSELFFDQFSRAGGDVVAGVLAWGCWFILAWGVVRLFARARAA